MLAVVSMALVSCGGGDTSSKGKAFVNLKQLDDYYEVKSYSLQTNIEEKGIDRLKDVKGTLTLVLKRNKKEMEIKPAKMWNAVVVGLSDDADMAVFHGDCLKILRDLMIENEKEATLEIPVEVNNPEEHLFGKDLEARKQAFYNALTKEECLSEIQFRIDISED